MKEISEAYIAVGAGGLSVIVVIWILIFLIKRLYPLIASMKEDNNAYKEIIKNNTDVVKEMSKSTENVATALKLLDSSINQLGTTLDRHDKRSEDIENNVIRMDEKLNTIRKHEF
jgi:Sec-independent protein translocase protein TatA